MGSSCRGCGYDFVSGFISFLWGACHLQSVLLFPFSPSLLISLRMFILYKHSAVLWPHLSHMQRHLAVFIFIGSVLVQWFDLDLMHHFEKFRVLPYYFVFSLDTLDIIFCFYYFLLPLGDVEYFCSWYNTFIYLGC